MVEIEAKINGAFLKKLNYKIFKQKKKKKKYKKNLLTINGFFVLKLESPKSSQLHAMEHFSTRMNFLRLFILKLSWVSDSRHTDGKKKSWLKIIFLYAPDIFQHNE